MPRIVSELKRSSNNSPSGRSNSAFQASSSPTWRRRSSADRSGSVNVGNTRSATAVVIVAQDAPRLGVVAEIGARAGRVGAINEDATITDWRVGREPAGGERQVESELLDDEVRKQADEVGELREAGTVTGEHLHRASSPADDVVTLEDEHRAAGRGEVGGCRQPVVPTADDDGVVPV